MSIAETGIIDAIGVDSLTNQVVLTISDHLYWDSEHLLMLQEKLNTYLGFVESGELLSTYPNSQGREVLINVVFKYPPDESGQDFLAKVHDIIEEAGMKFRYEVHAE